VHKSFIALQTVKVWRQLVWIVVVEVGLVGSSRVPVYLALLGFVFLALIVGPGLATLRWYRFTYEVTARELHIHQGIVFRKQTFIPGRRVHAVDVSAGLVERVLGVVKVSVQTAGGSTGAPEAVIEGLTLGEAELLRGALLGMRSTGARSEGAQSYSDATEQLAAPLNEFRGLLAGESADAGEPDFEYRLDTKGLLLAAATSGRTWIVLGAGIGLGSQAIELFGGGAVFDRIGALGLVAGIAIAAGLIVLSWAAAALTTVSAYLGFTVRRRGDRLEIERGLVEHQVVSLSLDRIQAVRIHQGFVRRLFGYCEVHVDTAGFSAKGAEAQQTHTVLHPFVRLDDAPALIDGALPGFVDRPALTGLPRRAMVRYILRWAVPVTVPALLAGVLVPGGWGWFGLIGVWLAVFAGVADHSTAAWGLSRRTLALRTGLLSITVRYLPRRRLQTLAYSQDPLQRVTRLASVRAAIISGGSGRTVTLSHVDAAHAYAIRDWYDPGSQRGPAAG
jgi:putative membrane protein